MAAYGTIMIGRLADGATVEQWMAGVEEWQQARKVDGFSGEYTFLADDGRLFSCVIFESKEQYQRLADDPDQDRWWSEKTRPLLAGEPEWIDGTWP
jgi:L-rhamnose mutarotase